MAVESMKATEDTITISVKEYTKLKKDSEKLDEIRKDRRKIAVANIKANKRIADLEKLLCNLGIKEEVIKVNE